MRGRDGTVTMHSDLVRSVVLFTIWRKDNKEATLRVMLMLEEPFITPPQPPELPQDSFCQYLDTDIEEW